MAEKTHKQQMVSGVAYTAVARYSQLVVMLAVQAVLMRIITPAESGIVATATVIIAFFQIFTDMGIGPAIIQHKSLSRRDCENIFGFSVWTGIILGMLFYAVSWPVAKFYDSPALGPICRLLSLNVLFVTLNIVPNALIMKDKRFKFIAVRTIVVQVISGVAAVVSVFVLPADKKLYALTVNPILSYLMLFVVNYREHPLRLRLAPGISSLRGIFKYSAFQFLFSFINYFSRNLDKLVLPKFLNMTELGFYEKSYRVMMYPLQTITNVFTPVMHPIFSEMQDELRRMLDNYAKVVRLLAFVGFPLSVLLVFGGRELVLLMFGPQWEAAVPPVTILALSVGFQMVSSSSGSIFQAAGDTRAMFFSGLISAVNLIVATIVPLVFFKTIESLSWGVGAAFAVNFVVTYVMMYRITFRVPMGGFWRMLFQPLLLSAITWAALWGIGTVLPQDMNMMLSLSIKCAVAGAVWLLYVELTGQYRVLAKGRQLWRSMRQHQAPAVDPSEMT